MIWLVGVSEAGGLLAEDCLLKLAVEECVLDVELVDGLVVVDSEGEHHSNGDRLDDGAKGLIISMPGCWEKPHRT